MLSVDLRILAILQAIPSQGHVVVSSCEKQKQQGDYDGRGQQTASPMLTAIMSGGVGISGRELYKYR